MGCGIAAKVLSCEMQILASLGTRRVIKEKLDRRGFVHGHQQLGLIASRNGKHIWPIRKRLSRGTSHAAAAAIISVKC